MSNSIFLPIKPEFCDKILRGKKRWEFRKNIPKDPIDTIVLYSSSPTQRIVGIAEVERILEESPDRLWKSTKKESGITEDFFFKYFAGCERAFAIRLGEIRKLIPFSPSEVGIVVPQSFCYLSRNQLLEIQDRIPLRVFITGIHGSGKSSICKKIEQGNSEFQHIICSDLIKYGGSRANVSTIDDNQEMLISELNGLEAKKKVLILDGHLSLISNGEVKVIDNRYISRMNIDLLVVKLFDPQVAALRIKSRDESEINEETLKRLQLSEISAAFNISSKLNIPSYISNSDEDIFRRIININGSRSIHAIDRTPMLL